MALSQYPDMGYDDPSQGYEQWGKQTTPQISSQYGQQYTAQPVGQPYPWTPQMSRERQVGSNIPHMENAGNTLRGMVGQPTTREQYLNLPNQNAYQNANPNARFQRNTIRGNPMAQKRADQRRAASGQDRQSMAGRLGGMFDQQETYQDYVQKMTYQDYVQSGRGGIIPNEPNADGGYTPVPPIMQRQQIGHYSQPMGQPMGREQYMNRNPMQPNPMAYQRANQNARFKGSSYSIRNRPQFTPQPAQMDNYLQRPQSAPQQPMDQNQYMQRSQMMNQQAPQYGQPPVQRQPVGGPMNTGGYDLPPLDANPYSPSGGQGMDNLQNMYRRKRNQYYR